MTLDMTGGVFQKVGWVECNEGKREWRWRSIGDKGVYVWTVMVVMVEHKKHFMIVMDDDL